MREIALVKRRSGRLRAPTVLLGCVLFAGACGGRVDSTFLGPTCEACETTGVSGGSSAGAASSGTGGEITAGTPSTGGRTSEDDPFVAASENACTDAVDVALGYFRDSQVPGPSMLSFDEQGQLIAPEVMLNPCNDCISKCSLVPIERCYAQDACVTRHCDCANTGCEGGIPTGDFCLCAATCMGPDQEACLEPWLDYGHCLASCANACS